MEEWRDISDYEGLYQVSNLGRVRRLNYRNRGTVKIITPKRIRTRKNGHLFVILWRDRKDKAFLIHRLVADAFIPNPLELPIVNHKDENPLNNIVDNLEWCTQSYNANYSLRHKNDKSTDDLFVDMKRFNSGKKYFRREDAREYVFHGRIIQKTMNGEIVNSFRNPHEAHIKTGFHNFPILECCKGKRKSAFGYRWEFEENDTVAVT